VIGRLGAWLRRLFGRDVSRQSTTTLIDRRVNELAGVSIDHEFCERVRGLELGLKANLHRLSHPQSDLRHLRESNEVMRRRITEYLDEPNGSLAVAIRAWPPLHEPGNGRLADVVIEGVTLHEEAGAFVSFVDEVLALRVIAAEMTEEFESSLPGYWASSGRPLIEYLDGVSAPSGLSGLRNRFTTTATLLRAQIEALTALRDELLSAGRVQLTDEELAEVTAMVDLELALRRLIERAEIQGRKGRSASVALTDVQVDAHLRHAGVRRPDIAVRHKTPGTAQRALARWKQIHRASDD